MILMGRRLSCCTRDREISTDFDEQDDQWRPLKVSSNHHLVINRLRPATPASPLNMMQSMSGITTYNGLGTCMINNQSYENESGTSRGDGCLTDSLDDDAYSSCSSSKDASGSVFSKWLPTKSDECSSADWEHSESRRYFYVKDKPAYSLEFSDVEAMKEKFSKLLLGDDITGGRKGVQTALALSNAITNLAASVFGELWKLEPLSKEKKNKWRREMDWLLSPTNYMIELVPSRQNGANGRTMEIMTSKARADIHMNLPALQKLDSMLIETLDSMVNTEFWYAEVGSRAEGRNKSTRDSKRWWLPLPQVPKPGLSNSGRKKLFDKGKVVYQVFKAAKSINENVILEMPVPNIIKDAIPKLGKTNLGDDLYRFLDAESRSADEILSTLNLGTEHAALETVNRLEAAIFAWKERIAEQANNGKSPVRTSWSFKKDPLSEIGRLELLLDRAKALRQEIKAIYPNFPPSFLDATKIQYGKDIGHATLEAYSRVLANLAFSILSRMEEILQEDALSNPNSPAPPSCFPGISRSPETPIVASRVRHSLIDQMNKVDGTINDSHKNQDGMEFMCNDSSSSLVTATPSRNRAWCISRESCIGVSMGASP